MSGQRIRPSSISPVDIAPPPATFYRNHTVSWIDPPPCTTRFHTTPPKGAEDPAAAVAAFFSFVFSFIFAAAIALASNVVATARVDTTATTNERPRPTQRLMSDISRYRRLPGMFSQSDVKSTHRSLGVQTQVNAGALLLQSFWSVYFAYVWSFWILAMSHVGRRERGRQKVPGQGGLVAVNAGHSRW